MAAAHPNIVEIQGLYDRRSGTAPSALMAVARTAKDGALIWFINGVFSSWKQERRALAPGAVVSPDKAWLRARAMLGATAAPIIGSFVAYTAVQKAAIAQGVDPVGINSVLVPFAALAAPNIAYMAAKSTFKPNAFLVGTMYATMVGEVYRKFDTRTYKYNFGKGNGL